MNWVYVVIALGAIVVGAIIFRKKLGSNTGGTAPGAVSGKSTAERMAPHAILPLLFMVTALWIPKDGWIPIVWLLVLIGLFVNVFVQARRIDKANKGIK